MNIAIDGPAGAGKSAISKRLAKELGILYVDTGALYRSIALYLLNSGVNIEDAATVEKSLQNITVELKYQQGQQHVFLNGEDVSEQIRTELVSMTSSKVSSLPCVRSFLFDLQREIAQNNDCIMDGRDIGTVVLPQAEVKIFLTASPEVRAKRRYKELREKGQDVSYDALLQDINQRDYNDTHRAIAPLKQAEDAVLLDTSDLNIDQVISEMKKIIESRENNERV